HKTLGSGYKLNDFVGKQVGFYGGNTESADSFDFIQCHDQFQKGLFAFSVMNSKVANIHSSEHNFFNSGCCDLFGLPYDVANKPTPAGSAGQRYGAEGTGVVASVLHFYECPGAITYRKSGDECLGFFNRLVMNHSLGLLGERVDVLNDIKLFCRTQNHIYAFDL